MKLLSYLLWLACFWGFTAWCVTDPVLVNLTGFNLLVSAAVSVAGWQYLWSQRFRDMP
jgi:hypothetical protein